MVSKKKTAGPSRKKKDLREKINVLALIEALENHVLGNSKMSATQVSAALALLKKTLPDIVLSSKNPEPPVLPAHEDALSELE